MLFSDKVYRFTVCSGQFTVISADVKDPETKSARVKYYKGEAIVILKPKF